MTKNQQRLLALALAASAESDYRRVRIGAVIAQGRRIVSVGWNSTRSEPMQLYYNQLAKRLAPNHRCHAEIAAIKKAGRNDLQGSTLYVGRWDRMGRLAMCRPCRACRLALERRGIRDVIYTTEAGIRHEHM